MRIYVISSKKIFRYTMLLLLVIFIISAASVIGVNAVGVFNSNKDLPIYFVDTSEKKAAITFDCAWGADDIPQILKTLKEEDVRASFFIVGQWAEKFPDTVKMISAGGHDIANHSYSHLRMGALDKKSIKSDISKCSSILGNLVGKKIDLFRPPYGDYSNNVVGTAREVGHYTIQWNVDSLDWKPDISKEEIINRITKRIVPGSIILFHNDTPHTANILPDIIAILKKEGYSFLPVSELILRENYYIDHEGKQKKKE
jgi:polysaccharide deacetylase family sporulation protein PdaB